MQIAVDTREQKPYTFEGYPCATVPATLTSGDYSLTGFESELAIERKGLSDLIGCLTRDRERFFRELERLRGYNAAALVIEAPYSDIAAGRYRSNANPAAVIQSLVAIMGRYRMPVYFADDRKAGEFFVYHFCRHWCNYHGKRLRALIAQKTIYDGHREFTNPDYTEPKGGEVDA